MGMKKYNIANVKSLANDFLSKQKDSMEQMSRITDEMHKILEKMARKEIEKDPVRFIRKESLSVKGATGSGGNALMKMESFSLLKK